MVHLGHDILQKLNQINVVSMFLFAIIFFILQYIFDMEFVCSCKRDYHQNGWFYFIVPPLILTCVVYVTEPFHQARIFSCFRIFKCNKKCFCVELFFNFMCVGSLWVASILFDGDWYVCLMTDRNSNQTGIPCKKDLTHEENQIKARYKTESLDWGLCVIGSVIIVWSVAESITACCKRKRTWKRGSCCDMLPLPYYRKVYEGLLEEQVSDYLKEELTKIAATRAKTICQPYLSTIREDERLPHNGGDGGNSVSDIREDEQLPNNGGDGGNSVSDIREDEQLPNNGGDGGNSVSDIREDEQLPNNGGDGGNSVNNTVLEAWKKISASDFPFSSNESHVGGGGRGGTSNQRDMDSGSTSSNRCLII